MRFMEGEGRMCWCLVFVMINSWADVAESHHILCERNKKPLNLFGRVEALKFERAKELKSLLEAYNLNWILLEKREQSSEVVKSEQDWNWNKLESRIELKKTKYNETGQYRAEQSKIQSKNGSRIKNSSNRNRKWTGTWKNLLNWTII